MNDFSAEWLALREDADHRARNSSLRDAVAATFTDRKELEIVDLGCGAGSNLRALAAYLPARQTWRLVDNDRRLLEAARQALSTWAEDVESVEPLDHAAIGRNRPIAENVIDFKSVERACREKPASTFSQRALVLRKQGRSIRVLFHEADLAAFDGAILENADLVTAAALFDLASQEWIERFCAALARQRAPLYAVLTYDGKEQWSPPHPADEAMLAAFHRHQTRDKGFGPALGPKALAALQRALEALGYAVAAAASPWRLSAPRARPGRVESRDQKGRAQNQKDGAAELIAALADGAAAAVAETALVARTTTEDWRRARRVATRVEIGHVDLFARFR